MMTIKKMLTHFFVMLGLLLVFTNSVADNEQIVMQGVFDGSDIQAGYIVANDMKFSVDNATRVYDTNGQLRSLRALRPGQHLEMYYRDYGAQIKNVSEMVLDKIIYYAK